MRQCNSCRQLLSEKITTCPGCGSQLVEGMKYIDDYKILHIIHEGYSSILCKARKDGEDTPVGIRLFTKESGVDQTIADRLKKELEELKKLPAQYFLKHYEIRKSSQGLWYRISEWVDGDSWGSIFVSDLLKDERVVINLFYKIASTLELLHKNGHFMPYLILDDILIPKDRKNGVNVKINYKLSRFLDPKSVHYGPMLEHLILNHPDILNDRGLNSKTDIWSLGKVFIELLTADINATDHSSKIDGLKIDPELATLLKVMLSNDPDLRPQTMSKVVETLARILGKKRSRSKDRTVLKKGRLLKEITLLKKTVILLLIIITGIAAFNSISWFYLKSDIKKDETTFTKFIENYAPSIAFIMVEYRLENEDNVVYQKKVEGTAFLVDKQGYLLTNRHVACPWLEDNTLFQVFSQFSLLEKPVTFNSKMYLWFEGEKAFNRIVALGNSEDISDIYNLASAYTTKKPGNLKIVGVPRTAGTIGELITSPFRGDFAVLKLSDIPENLIPLPLELNIRPVDIPRLSPVIILGFPLGKRTQLNRVNASITRGHVRRTSKEIIQVDSSIYKGNSGGPAVNTMGKVIGIASGVITDQSNPYLNIVTPLSDFGLILPITRAVSFIEDLKSGKKKWDGSLDFSLPEKIEKISKTALSKNFDEALQLSLQYLQDTETPLLIYATAMLYFCQGQYDQSNKLFGQMLSMEEENNTSRLMLSITDWVTSQTNNTTITNELLAMDWRNKDEFLGHLIKLLKNQTIIEPDIIDWESKTEKSWRYFINGLVLEKQKKYSLAKESYKNSILSSGSNDWIFFLSLARLNNLDQAHIKNLSDEKKIKEYVKKTETFLEKAKNAQNEFDETSEKISELFQVFGDNSKIFEERLSALENIIELAPENINLKAKLAFFYAINSKWENALISIQNFLAQPGRESSLRLSIGILEGQTMNLLENKENAKLNLINFSQNIHDPWYQALAESLIDGPDEDILIKKAMNRPENLLTMHTALGLRAEGLLEKEKAIHHYREALGSYLDDRLEYEFALGRILYLKKK